MTWKGLSGNYNILVNSKTKVLGIGNTILSDDSVGIRVVREIKRRLPDIEVDEMCASGVSVLDFVEGYDKVVIVDSMKTGRKAPGTLVKLQMSDLSYAINLSSCHGLNLPSAIELGRKYYDNIPDNIDIYAVEIVDNTTYAEECTPFVEKAIPRIADSIIKEQFYA